MRGLLLDLEYCMRSLGRAKWFSFIVVATLTLGMVPCLIVFSVVNSVLMRPLQYPHPDRLVVVHSHDRLGRNTLDLPAPAFFYVKQRAPIFKNIAVIYPLASGVNLSADGVAQYVRVVRVSSGLFATLGAAPFLGRGFKPEEDQPGTGCVAVLSYKLWSLSFNRSTSVPGQTIHVNGEPCVVNGVMPRGFRAYPDADLWVPLALSETTADPGSDYRVIARLSERLSRREADAALKPLSELYRQAFSPATPAGDMVFAVDDLQHFITGSVRKSLYVLSGAVFFVLMITCTNLALLLVVRAMARTREFAIRAALGSGRRRIVRLFMIEGFLLVGLGGAAGVIATKELLPITLSLMSQNLPPGTEVHMDWEIFLFAGLVSALIAVIFGFVPALKLSASDLSEKLRSGSQSITPSKQQTRIAHLLVSLQTGLALILLAGAGFLLQSFARLRMVPPGFDPNQVLVAHVSLASSEHRTTTATSRTLDNILSGLRDLPDVESVADVSSFPLERGLNLPVHPMEQPRHIVQVVEYRAVSPGYFATLRIRKWSGRFFDSSDDFPAEPVAVINQTLARTLWPQTSPIGHFIDAALGEDLRDVPRRVIGVASDFHETGMARPAPPMIFVPLGQRPDKITEFSNRLFLTAILVRTTKRTDISGDLDRVLAARAPALPSSPFRPVSSILEASMAQPRFYALITSAFGIFAVLVTAIGVYGLLSYQVGQRVREIGIRMAFGARRSSVVGLILLQGIKLVAAGAAPGVVGAFFLKEFLGNMFYNPLGAGLGLLVVTVFVLAVVVILVSLATAVDAASIEPMVALRNE